MSEEHPFVATITFTNGAQRSFEFLPIGEQDPQHYFRRANEMHDSGELVMEMDDRIITFVTANIISIEVSPKPGRIAKNAIKTYREIT